MAKNKHRKYERVKNLPNVIFAEHGSDQSAKVYPWHAKKYHDKKRVLELGCGKGEHTLFFAARQPENLYVGIDCKSHRMCVGAEKAIDQGLENVIFFRARIEAIELFFDPHSIDQIWLTFPDPHVKNSKAKSRLSAPDFLAAYENLLVPGGRIFLKTDSEVFFQHTLQNVTKRGGQLLALSDDIHTGKGDSLYAGDVVSAFEKNALEKGRAIKFLAFSLR